MTSHLHDYRDALSADEPHKRRCCSCGEPQVYRAPTGVGRTFDDVSIAKTLLAPIFRLAVGVYSVPEQERLDREEILAAVVPLLDTGEE